VGDYFFVAPLGLVTVHDEGLRLLLLLLLGAAAGRVMMSPGSRRQPANQRKTWVPSRN
jgi:hypothetical protein